MKTIVIYKSTTGFSKQYAEWISEKLGCEVKDIKDASSELVSKFDCVIYGSSLMGNMIRGLDKVQKMNPKKLVVFAVGISNYSKDLENQIKDQNKLSDTPIFYMQGGLHWDKLGFVSKGMLNMVKKSTLKKTDLKEEDRELASNIGSTFDRSDIKYISPLVETVKKLAS